MRQSVLQTELKDKRLRSERDKSLVEYFSQSNPKGPGQDDVPALLRRVADTLEERNPTTVFDLVLHNENTEDGDWFSISVYYDTEPVDPVKLRVAKE